MGASGNSGCQWACRSVLRDFAEDVVSISAFTLFPNGAARMVKANSRRGVQHSRWWNLKAWPRSPLRVGCAKVDATEISRRPWLLGIHGFGGVWGRINETV